jgi:Flp pilus assembly protein TadD
LTTSGQLARLGILVLVFVSGCQWPWQAQSSSKPGPIVAAGKQRNTTLARQCNAEATRLLAAGQTEAALKQVRAALDADPLFGPAHNNLGTIYFRQRKYYDAAWEFQYAANLQPEKAAPRNNLGMVFEMVGRLDDAALAYEEARKLDPVSTEIAGNLARIRVRTHRDDEETRRLLAEIVAKDPRPEWVAWARERLAVVTGQLGASSQSSSAPAEEPLVHPRSPSTQP